MDGLRIAVRGSYSSEVTSVSCGNMIACRTRRAVARRHGNGFAWSAARQYVRFYSGSASRGWNARLCI